jgi:hypothetical protein
MTLSPASLTTAGTLLMRILLVEFGGLYVLRLVRGRAPATPFQKTFARAGHAHAGVFVILSLTIQPFVDAAALDGLIASLARSGVPLAAVLMPAGFFLASAGQGRTEPNALIVLIYAGAAALAVGVGTLGLGLLGIL